MEIKATLNKPYTEKERVDFVVRNNHKLGYEIKETDEALEAWGLSDDEVLERVKESKIQENDIIRDKALNQGVTYREVLFDSDTDQKINLLAIVSTMQDEDVITWFGKNNNALNCTKEDLINIGSLITKLHSFCWAKNAEIKQLINKAETIEEVNAIEIDYKEQENEN